VTVFTSPGHSTAMNRGPMFVLAMFVASGCVAPTEELEAPVFLLMAPEVLDLGWITPGEPAEASLIIENVGEATVEIQGVALREMTNDLALESRVVPTVVPPGESAEVFVLAVAQPSAPDAIALPLTFSVDGFAADDPRLPVVELQARVSRSGLIAEPNPLTIGPVLYLETQTGTVALRNLRSSPIDVYALRHSQGRAQYEEAVTRGAFGLLPEVGADGLIMTLGPHERRVIDIDYTAPDGPGEAKEQAVWRVASCLGDDDCALDIVIQGLPDIDAPNVFLSPTGVHFGPISVGAVVEQELRITNNGRRALEVSNARFTGSPEFSATLPGDTKVEPGGEIFATFRYTPSNVGLDNAELVFESNDPLNRTATVRVTGAGVILPPCRVEARPSVLDFGIVDPFDTHTLVATVTNVGDETCVVFDPQIRPGSGTEPLTFYFERTPAPSVTLEPNTVTTYTVTYAPTRPGNHSGALVLKTSATDTIEIPLRGKTPDGQSLSCTPDRTVDLGATVALNAALAEGESAQRHDWRLLSGPMSNGSIAATLSPNGGSAELIPHLVGTYVVQVEVTTTAGERYTCETQVYARSTGFRATLTWDGPGDLDLHVHRGASAPWFGPADCHFDNLQPEWDPAQPPGTGPNARLDGDDTSGDGPEHIRIAAPEIGVPYTIAVGHFERAQGRIANVEVFCGRAIAEVDVISRPFTGNGTGACTNNDFWTVATVVFTDAATCTVQTIDTYRSTAEACAAF
jgi:hypothetical protein